MMLAAMPAAPAADTADTSVDSAFGLGKIERVTVTGIKSATTAIGESKVTSDELYTFSAITLDKAIELVPGVSIATTGGTRNEKQFYIRGFDRFESPLYVDGIRIYLPADNRLDIGFFNTANLAQVQVEKGYVSVLSGPGALGGAVNMVTRKPTADFEYETRGGLALSGDGGYNGYTASTLVGGMAGHFYALASGGITKFDKTELSDDFIPTASEDGGARNHTASRNYNLNLKVGWQPNATDEYSLSYSGQWGRKEAPYSTVDSTATQKNWTWPYWDVQNLYFLSHTGFGSNAYLNTKVYYSKFRNGLYSYDNATFTTMTLPKAFRSFYSDYALGGSVEGGYDFGTVDTLKLSYFYRRDSHTEWQITYKPALTEPEQTSVEDTHSLVAENRLHVTEGLDLVAGLSYDIRHLLKAQDYSSGMVNYPLADDDALNVQGMAIYDFGDGSSLHVSVSDRTRFPTLFERYSTKFGTTLSNPDLRAERAVNYEIGGSTTVYGINFEGAVYYSEISKMLENVPISFCDITSTSRTKTCTNGSGTNGVLTSTSQTQNVGDAKFVGFEFSADKSIAETLKVGLRYAYTDRSIDAQSPDNPSLTAGYHLTGAPNGQMLAYVTWQALPQLSFTPSLQTASKRWTTNTAGSAYFKTGSYALINLQADYAITDTIDFSASVKNLFDVNYSLAYGFPEQGRNVFVGLRIKS
jgi:iron complex outermembrane recepter protein